MRHGSHLDPPNRFETIHAEAHLDDVAWDDEYLRSISNRKIEYLDDASKSIVSENKSPDIPFRYSINPYRGCAHGCSYCYARNSHEYLGFNAGLDFETKIVVKREASKLLREFLARDTYAPEPIVFSGVTDCYQPAERQFRLTRQCLEVALECRQPIGIVTKNALVVRDLDLLTQLAQQNLAKVFVSINSLDAALARDMEPRTSTPEARLRSVRLLAQAGVPVGVMVSPIIPGLNDNEIPDVLKAAQQAGAKSASYILLRLPITVEPVFLEWLERTQPTKFEKVVGLIRQTRAGELNNSDWGERMKGRGPIAEQIRGLFRLFARKYELDQLIPSLDCTKFQPPASSSGQLRLF